MLINQRETTKKQFERQFSLSELLDNSRIPYSQIKKDSGNITIKLCDEDILIDDLDFNLLIW